MASALVINHGTTTDTDAKPKNLLSELTRLIGCSPFRDADRLLYLKRSAATAVITNPGFGTENLMHRMAWISKDSGGKKQDKDIRSTSNLARAMTGSAVSLALAKPFMSEVAGWLKHDLEHATNGKLADIRDIVFIGWSRGAILTWYQIHGLLNDPDFRKNPGRFHVLGIDPSYGPTMVAHPEIRRAQRHVDSTGRSWEILMLFQYDTPSNARLLLDAYPTMNPQVRFFLPGQHSSPVESDKYGDIKRIGQQIVAAFLARCNLGFPTTYHPPNDPEVRKIYAKCKIVDKSWNYSNCFRNSVKGLYQLYRSNKPWTRCGFFYNDHDYYALQRKYPATVKAFRHERFEMATFAREYKEMSGHEPMVARSIHDWADHTHFNPRHRLGKSVRDFLAHERRRDFAAMF